MEQVFQIKSDDVMTIFEFVNGRRHGHQCLRTVEFVDDDTNESDEIEVIFKLKLINQELYFYFSSSYWKFGLVTLLFNTGHTEVF